MILFPFIFLTILLPSVFALKPKPSLLKKNVENSVTCDFSIHRAGPHGPVISGTSLDDELYYKISCKPLAGHCLQVINCTLSSDEPGFRPFPIIDDNGCSLDDSLYKNVQYRTDFEAGIYNPYPIRFRTTSSKSVVLFCVTSVVPLEDNVCTRRSCQ
ncbi:unnamed protein product [Caenorhabditis auriculariae]|uniref:ZP domain-containing protein n=1 Tax=Caenorhabditis auriculariae TaxID=2777116 RepID=A0A8S1HMD0_9PELO|nr:unnamed protein product [Caenorhabditis auriculariae]